MGAVEFTQRLIGDMVAVQPEVQPRGKILLPDWQRTLRGTVLAIGPGDPLPKGGVRPMMCAVGDTVIFGAATGMESQYKGAMIRVMHDTDVDAVVGS
jgi:co-chaperonin GroES (HSP10)